MSLQEAVLLAALVSGGVYCLGFVVTHFASGVRVWPLGEKSWSSWEKWFNYVFGIPFFFGIPILGFLDWNSFVLSRPASLYAGIVLLVVGLGITFDGLAILGLRTSVGETGALQTDGLYRYTRNPQVIGDLVSLVGVVAITNSWLVLWVCVLNAVWHLLLPYIEEPWLYEQFGDPYKSYLETTPRFVDGRTVRRLLGR